MSKMYSIDVESNGLHGLPFAIAVVVSTEAGEPLETVSWRCPVEGDVNPWVSENVLPEMVAIPETHATLSEMLKAFSAWWMVVKADGQLLWHMGHIVETRVFRECLAAGYIGEWDLPYTVVEVSSLLTAIGEPADSVDGYITKRGLAIPEVVGGTHNPIYDAMVALACYRDIMERISVK